MSGQSEDGRESDTQCGIIQLWPAWHGSTATCEPPRAGGLCLETSFVPYSESSMGGSSSWWGAPNAKFIELVTRSWRRLCAHGPWTSNVCSAQALADLSPLASWVWLSATVLLLLAARVGHLSLLVSLLALGALSQRIFAVVEQLTACCTRPWHEALVLAVLGKVELVIFSSVALQRGELDLVQVVLMGSALFALIPVPAVSLLVGAVASTKQSASYDGRHASLGVVILAAGAAVFPALLTATTPCMGVQAKRQPVACKDGAAAKAVPLSHWCSGVLLAMYGVWLWRCGTAQAGSDRQASAGNAGRRALVLLGWVSLLCMAAGAVSKSVLIALSADLRWRRQQLLVSAIFIPTALNCGDLTSGALHAWQGRLGASARVAVGSAVQVLLCLLPTAVLGAAMHGVPLSFTPNMAHAAALLLASTVSARAWSAARVSVVNGAALLGAYIILAASFWAEGQALSQKKSP